MKLTAYDQIELFNQLEPEWNALLSRSIANRIFSTWEWQSTWWESYCPGELWVVTCRDDGGQLLGIAPWFIEQHPTYGRVVRSIGCVEVTDYLDIIVDQDHVEPVLEAFAALLSESAEHYDVVDLCNLPESSPIYQLFPDILRKFRFEVEVKQQEVCPVIALPSTWDEYLEKLDKKQRHEIRRKIRRAEGNSEAVHWYIVDETHNLEAEIEQFLTLMGSSHPEKAKFLQDRQNVNFFRKIVPKAYQNGWLQMSFLKIGNTPVATYLNFDYQEQILVYNSGLLPGQYDNLSPGIVLLAYNIRHAIDSGHKVFDFLRGNETYKYRMGAEDTRVFMLRAELN